jgi:hypothetical protein
MPESLPHRFAGLLVSQILRHKKAGVRTAPLFKSDGSIHDAAALKDLLANRSDSDPGLLRQKMRAELSSYLDGKIAGPCCVHTPFCWS